VPPFSGAVKDGFIYGRGALDMKGLGILELLAFLEIKRQRIIVLCLPLILPIYRRTGRTANIMI
jgi:hypothetical protein